MNLLDTDTRKKESNRGLVGPNKDILGEGQAARLRRKQMT